MGFQVEAFDIVVCEFGLWWFVDPPSTSSYAGLLFELRLLTTLESKRQSNVLA